MSGARLRGRWLITGASRGIGAALAREVAARGALVALVARSPTVLELARELGGSGHIWDLAAPGDVDAGLRHIEAEGGPIDVLVNNAAVEVVGALRDASEAELRDAVSTNLLAPLLLTRAALPRLAERGGWVVNVSSMAATAAFPGMAAYAATKAGLSQLSRVLAPEAAAQGVGMTLVTLGPVVTAMLESNRGYDPVRAAFDRARRLRFSRDLEPAAVARALVDAAGAGRPELVLPRRMTPFALLGRLPQRITAFLLRGLPALTPSAP